MGGSRFIWNFAEMNKKMIDQVLNYDMGNTKIYV